MRLKKETKIYSDFETTIDNPVKTEVWSAASIIGGTRNDPSSVAVQTSIGSYMKWLFNQDGDLKVYFHNLKFDGSFILTWLLENPKFTCDAEINDGRIEYLNKNPGYKMPSYSFTYSISAKGMWYSITIRLKKKVITIWDSLKLIPLSLAKAAKAFKTKHQKLEMEYKNHKPGDKISKEELKYIQNDVLVLKECMEAMQAREIDSMTIGGACLKEFQEPFTKEEQQELFPDLTKTEIPDDEKGRKRTADDFIRRSYHGGFCYVNPKYQGKLLTGVISHVDANSHYPSQMHSKSGNYYPVGQPIYFSRESFGKISALPYEKCYYFVRVKGTFSKKSGFLPTIQIKDDSRFARHRNEWLESSCGLTVDLVLTRQDYEKMLQNYYTDFEVVEGIAFKTVKGLFDKYIDKWYKVKEGSKGAIRQIAKLFLNNLYGKFAASTDSSYKVAYLTKNGLRYENVVADDKEPGYIAIGSAITSYARNRTISLAEKYYESYVYSDTDSNVYMLPEGELKGIPKHPSAICYWGVESESDSAIFVRQKTYIEHVHKNDSVEVEPYFNIRCCGMGTDSKKRLNIALNLGMSLEEFKPGFVTGGTLKAKSVYGGTLLVDAGYKMR